MAMPKRRWGLILVVLVFDLGLAAAGAYLLNEGLSAGQPAKPEPTPGSATVKTGNSEQPPSAVANGAEAGGVPPQRSAAVKALGSASANGAGSATAVAETPAPAGSGSDGAQGRQANEVRKLVTRKVPAKPGSKPIDPYDDKLGPPPPGPPQGPAPPP